LHFFVPHNLPLPPPLNLPPRPPRANLPSPSPISLPFFIRNDDSVTQHSIVPVASWTSRLRGNLNRPIDSHLPLSHRSVRSHSSPFRSRSSRQTKPPETLPALPETLPKSPHECSEATCDPSEVTRHSREVTSHAGEAARRPLRSHYSPLRSHSRPARSHSATLPKPPATAPKSSEMTADSVATTAKSLNDDPRLGQTNLPSQSSRLTTHPSRLTTWSATTADLLQTSPASPATAHALVETNDDLRELTARQFTITALSTKFPFRFVGVELAIHERVNEALKQTALSSSATITPTSLS
jgi:hypothetical protein